MTQESLIDFGWRDLFAAAIDHLFKTSDDRDEAVAVDAADVTSSEPTIGESGGIRFGIVDIAGRHARPAHDDLAELVGGQDVPLVVTASEFARAPLADRPALASVRGKGVCGNKPRFAEAVSLQNGCCEDGFQALVNCLGQRRGAGMNKAQRVPKGPIAAARMFEDSAMHRRARRVPARSKALDQVEQAATRRRSGANNASTR